VTSPEIAGGRTLAGSCLCGAVHYAVTDGIPLCRELPLLGLPAADGRCLQALRGIERDKLRISAGADMLMTFGGDSAHDVRCKRCGSYLYSVVREAKFVHVALGTLADAPSIRRQAHLRRLQGAVVRHHRRPAAMARARGGTACRQLG